MSVRGLVIAALAALCGAGAEGQIAVRGKTVYTMAGAPIADGVVVMHEGKIAAVGPAATTPIPQGFTVLEAAVVTPGLVDARSTVGLSGMLNAAHDSDQLERSSPIQPELRAIDAYNPHERLVGYVRSFGVTVVNTGHAPGELISGQTFVVKTVGNTAEEALVRSECFVAATLSPIAQKEERGKAPGTRAKMMSMLREELLKAKEYAEKQANADETKRPARNLRSETLARVLKGEIPLLITANRAQDIDSCLRLAEEFKFRVVLDSAAEAYLLTDRIKASGAPVIVHPTMQRAVGDSENQTFENAAILRRAGIPVAIPSGYEGYVPKARIVLFEAAIAAANGLTFDQALASITIDAAKIIGVDARVGSIEVGKDGDVALYSGDPFEYTTRCVGVVINGRAVSDTPR